MKKINADNFRKDKMYPGIAKAVTEILETGRVVTPVDVLIRTHRLTKQQYEDWRFGRIPYLERVCQGGLGNLCRFLRILETYMRTSGLKPSQTVYCKWGKGEKGVVLRFSKSGDPNLEAAYSRHYIAKERRKTPPAEASETNVNAAEPL